MKTSHFVAFSSEGTQLLPYGTCRGYLRSPFRILHFGASRKWTLLGYWGLRRACNSGDGRLGSQDSSSEFLGVLGAARSALSGSEQFGVLGRP